VVVLAEKTSEQNGFATQVLNVPDPITASGVESSSVGSEDGDRGCVVDGRVMLGVREGGGAWIGGSVVMVVAIPEVASASVQKMVIRGNESVEGLAHLAYPRLKHRHGASTLPGRPRGGTP